MQSFSNDRTRAHCEWQHSVFAASGISLENSEEFGRGTGGSAMLEMEV